MPVEPIMMMLWHHVLRQVGRELLPPNPVAQGDRDGALGRRLPDHVFVEFGDDLPRRQLVQTQMVFDFA
jgi:hypothetical protein